MTERAERILNQPRIALYQWAHSPLNVQGALRAGKAFGDFANSLPPSGMVVLLDEAIDMSTSREERDGVSTLVNNYGLSSLEVSLAYARFHGEPLTYEELVYYQKELGSMTPGELIRHGEGGTYPLSLNIPTYLFYRIIDRTAENDTSSRAYRFEMERHRAQTIRRISGDNTVDDARYDEIEWRLDRNDGIHAAQMLRKEVYGLNRTNSRYRERRIADQVTSLVRGHPADGIFMLYGAAHELLGNKITRRTGIQVAHLNSAYSHYPGSQQTVHLYNPEGQPDFNFKCEMLSNILMRQISAQCLNEGLMSGYMLRYEDVLNNLWGLLYSLSEIEIDSLLTGGIHGFFHEVMAVVRSQIYEDNTWH